MKKILFKNYILGYLNEYNSNKFYLNTEDNRDYKKFKSIKVSHYLNIPFKLLNILVGFLSFFEVPISLFILSVIFVKCSIINLMTPFKRVINGKLMFGLYNDRSYFNNVMSASDSYINLDDLTIVTLPSIKAKYNDFKCISIFSGINYRDILRACSYSIEMIFYMKNKYGDKDLFFRSYSSFEYFLCHLYAVKSHRSNIYYFDALIDRFAYLHGGLKHKTVFIQHGIVIEKMKIRKIGKIDCALYINEKQKDICEMALFMNKPSFNYLKQSDFKPSSNNLIENGFENILLICNMLFYDKEKEIIKDLSSKKVNLYVKPHPNSSNDPYEKLSAFYNFVILQREDLPKVDIVISYSSTLATAYENYGIKVLNYDDELFRYKYEKI
jgi:hypothetical protein